MKIIRKKLASLALVATAFAVIGTALPAQAATGGTEPAPSQTIVLTAHVAGSAVASASGGATVTASASTFDFVDLQVMATARTTSNCITSTGWNYNPGVGWHYETVPMKLCKLAKPKMVDGKLATYLKKGGGASGSACDNYATADHTPPAQASPRVLDLRMGNKGVVRTKAFASANTSASVDVVLEYTYNGTTLSTTQRVDAEGSAASSAKDKAVFKMTKHLRAKSTGGTITKAIVRAESKAKAKANALALADAKSKAEAHADLSVTIVIPGTPLPPSPTPAYSCDSLAVNKGTGRTVNIANFSTSQSGGATFKHAVIEWGDGSSDTFVSPVGKTHSYAQYDTTYVVKATAVFVVNGMEKSVSSSACQAAISFPAPPVVDTPPSVNGQVPEHVIYGDDALWADFDATDAEGHPITFEYSYDGPINIQAIQEVNTSEGKRLSIKFSAKYVAPGTTQDAHFYVTAVANGKRSSQFVGTVQVANLG